jgi:hypothetical protein
MIPRRTPTAGHPSDSARSPANENLRLGYPAFPSFTDIGEATVACLDVLLELVFVGPTALPLPPTIPASEREVRDEDKDDVLGLSAVGRLRNLDAIGALVDVFLDSPWDTVGIVVGQQLHYVLSANIDNLFLVLPSNCLEHIIRAFPKLGAYRQAIALQLLELACIKRAVRNCLIYAEFEALQVPACQHALNKFSGCFVL